jgi:hypothetical protein
MLRSVSTLFTNGYDHLNRSPPRTGMMLSRHSSSYNKCCEQLDLESFPIIDESRFVMKILCSNFSVDAADDFSQIVELSAIRFK